MIEKHLKAIDSLKPSQKAVDNAVEAALKAQNTGKVIEMKKAKKHISIKIASGIAACLAVAVALTGFFTTAGTGKNSFVITAYAAGASGDEAIESELNANEFKTLGVLKGGGEAWSSDNDVVTDMDIKLESKLICEGNNIKDVTYSIDNGYVGVLEDEGLISYKEKMSYDDLGYSVGINGKDVWEYREISISGKSRPEYMDFQFRIVPTADTESIFAAYAKYASNETEYLKSKTDAETVESNKKAVEDLYNSALKDRYIHITVTFRDGSTESRRLALETKCQVKEYDFTDELGRADIVYLFTPVIYAMEVK